MDMLECTDGAVKVSSMGVAATRVRAAEPLASHLLLPIGDTDSRGGVGPNAGLGWSDRPTETKGASDTVFATDFFPTHLGPPDRPPVT